MQDHVSTNAFKFPHIKNVVMFSQSKLIKKQGINTILTLPKEKYMQDSPDRVSHIFQSSHNPAHARSQGYFRLVMGMRVKVWSIWVDEFTFSKHRCNYFLKFLSFLTNLELKLWLFTHFIWNPLYFITFLFHFFFFKAFSLLYFFL